MVVADLHVHTDASDGILTIEEIPSVAKSLDIQVIAVTDHDRIHPSLSEPMAEVSGVTLIHGIELRVEAQNVGRFDLLGYGVNRSPALERMVKTIQTDRIERAATMIDSLEDHLDIELDLTVESGVGRPHIARAIAEHPALDFTVDDAFSSLIGADCPCYVRRTVPSYRDGLTTLRASCRIVGLAHPLRYRDSLAVIETVAEVDGIELWYPYAPTIDLTPVRDAIDRFGFLPTGGSDAHDTDIGAAGMSSEAYEKFKTEFEKAVS